MSSDWIDVSVPLSELTPTWPGVPPVSFTTLSSLDRGDLANDTQVTMSLHSGTHVDAPLHFLKAGKSVDCIPFSVLMGPARVVEFLDSDRIECWQLEQLEIDSSVTRLLFKTRNSVRWLVDCAPFDHNFVALTSEAAAWVAARNIELVGIDYLSIQRFQDGPQTHLELLRKGIVILEGLDLSQVCPGDYELLCLPLKFHGVEASPVRALLRPLPSLTC